MNRKKPLVFLSRVVRARPRLVCGMCFGLLLAQGLDFFTSLDKITVYLIGWNAGAVLYLALAGYMIFYSDEAQIRDRAIQEDEGQKTILILVTLAAMTCLFAIVVELSVAKTMEGMLRVGHIGLCVLTLATSWFFTHTMFALHYAHHYHIAERLKRTPGLLFPGEERPDYGDFFYFSIVIGTSGQTADVNFTSRATRRIGTLHCILSFLFNASLLGLMINIAAGLMG